MQLRAALAVCVLFCACTSTFEAPAPAMAVRPGTPVDCAQGRHPSVSAMRRLSVAQYANAVRDVFDNRVRPGPTYPGPYGSSISGFSSEPSINEVGEQSTEQLLTAAEEVGLAVAPVVGQLLPCAAQANEACAATFVDTYARRAYRRAVTADEREALLKTYRAARTGGATFPEAIAITSAHLMQTPQFLYVAEDAAGEGRELTSIELATRLSFLLWDSVPDDALLAQAEGGALTNPEVLAAEAQRLLASSKADTAMARFFREWAQIDRVSPSDKDTAAFPFFNASYANAINESFDRFVLGQLRGGGTLKSLLTGSEVYVNADLASSFGVTAPPAGTWVRLDTSDGRAAGLSTQPLLLASASHASEPSYVYRGRFVRKRLLCDTFGPPPADAQATFSGITLPPNPTARQVSDSVRARAACGACHNQIDPPGLAYEHFDAVGRYRETYPGGGAIETGGEMPVRGQTVAFSSGPDLMQQLAEHAKVKECLSLQLFRFAFSRVETEADVCTVNALGAALEASDFSLNEGLMALTRSDAFWLRSDP
jgi:Protein of unknown function (DUF1592)/Protein of unknown function (DUF1588)/Protein of unknown function (DUF1595)/Protein of unknown function (DUF1585)/Protein of unknown function (DUF1587)